MFRLFAAFAVAFVTTFSIVPSASAFGGKGCGGEEGCAEKPCTECHSLSIEEASKLFKTDSLGATVLDVKESPVSGVWEVSIQQGPNVFKLYVGYGKKYFFEVRGNEFVEIARIGKLRKIDFASIPLGGAIVIGDKDAAHKVVVFDDPDCPYCGRFHGVAKDVVAERSDIAFFIKMFPLVQIHPGAYEESRAILCGEDPLKLLEDAFAGKTLPPAGESCTTTEVDDNMALGRELGITGTPAIILPDGRVQPGFVEADRLIELVDNPG